MKLFCFFSVLLFCSMGFTQNNVYYNSINKQSIKTLKVIVEGNDRSYPAIDLYGENKIQIQFDDLNTGSENYSYSLIHCNADWTKSDVFFDEYISGFNENSINDFDYSINTKVPYINYRVSLPNNDVQFKVSGNYVFCVYENGDLSKEILTARFVIYERSVRIIAEVVRPLGVKIQNNSQEIKLTVNHEQIDIGDPYNDIKVVINQNNRPDKQLQEIKPVFVKNNELVYSFSGDNILEGGNEFRSFGFTNIYKFGMNVNDIQYVDTIYHVQLRIDERRSAKRYFWEEEMNGKSFVYLDNLHDAHIEADYAYVYFAMPMLEPFIDGSVFVYGDFNFWKKNTENKMEYNFDNGTYECKILLKQGYYNYAYTFLNNYTKKAEEAYLEGSHYQTENDYIIYVYHKGFSEKVDRLIGYKVVNSKYQE